MPKNETTTIYVAFENSLGTPTKALAPGFNKHQACAIVIKSPQGFKLSPYLPRPLCSNEEKVTTASNWGIVPSTTDFLKVPLEY